MKPRVALLGLVLLLGTTMAAEESCVGNCGSFSKQRKCQCDPLCVYYGSCCSDFDTVCPKKIARGDTFQEVEVTETATTPTQNTVTEATIFSTFAAPTPASPPPSTTAGPSSPPVHPDAAPCSGRPFDAFLQLKNGSIYAFRGEYFFELDDTSVLPGYPKLIEDVWGIPGPIDAAFTRVNCQGQTYIFKGNRYWRFNNDILDDDYPREISVGFEGIPDGIDATFAIPAPGHLGREKAYFFKGDKYYQYEFKHQPSHEECVSMSQSSPSVLFSQYTDVFCDQTLEHLFTELFGGSVSSHFTGPRLTSRDWQGIQPPVDSAMVGRVYFSPKPTSPPPQRRRQSSWKRKPRRKRPHRGRQSRHVLEDLLDFDWIDFDYFDTTYESIEQHNKSNPVQKVYFFKRDKYYRVDLHTKRVDSVSPPYPRSIAKYWLGCKYEERPNTSRAEKR